jgi:protocatechuate 3,4-dioxygenase beta subunit
MRIFAPLALLLTTLSASAIAAGAERILGPCEGCEAVFQGRPTQLASQGRIAPAGSSGEAMQVDGIVRDAKGKPSAGIIVYAYQTDHTGIYPRLANAPGRESGRHGAWRGFVVTDAQGRYRFDTTRPGGYPGTDIPQHIHMHVVEPGRCTTYVDDIVFEDDPRLTPRQRAAHSQGRGGSGVVMPVKEGGVWKVNRDIALGQGISNYAECGR